MLKGSIHPLRPRNRAFCPWPKEFISILVDYGYNDMILVSATNWSRDSSIDGWPQYQYCFIPMNWVPHSIIGWRSPSGKFVEKVLIWTFNSCLGCFRSSRCKTKPERWRNACECNWLVSWPTEAKVSLVSPDPRVDGEEWMNRVHHGFMSQT